MVITWTKPISDGGSVITQYNVEVKDGTSEWKHHCIADPQDGTCMKKQVDGLSIGHRYQFRIKATNTTGTGDASEPSDVESCKPRLGRLYIIRSACHYKHTDLC